MNTGVYIITNYRNGKIYIGSSSRNIYERFKKHKYLLYKNKHPNQYFQRAWNKYNKTFFFSILEFCNSDKCIEREQYYIDLLKPEYNICKVAGSSLGVKFSEETKEKIRQKALGRKCKTKGICFHTEEGKYKILQSIQHTEVYQYKNDELVDSYFSISDCSKKLGITRGTLRKMINNPNKKFKKYNEYKFKIRKF